MQKQPMVGDVVELRSMSMRPQYLNGAHVKITNGGPVSFDGELVKTGAGPKRSYKNRVGQRIRGIQPSMIGHVFEAA